MSRNRNRRQRQQQRALKAQGLSPSPFPKVNAPVNQERCKAFHETVTVPLSKPVRKSLLRRALGLFIF